MRGGPSGSASEYFPPTFCLGAFPSLLLGETFSPFFGELSNMGIFAPSPFSFARSPSPHCPFSQLFKSPFFFFFLAKRGLCMPFFNYVEKWMSGHPFINYGILFIWLLEYFPFPFRLFFPFSLVT